MEGSSRELSRTAGWGWGAKEQTTDWLGLGWELTLSLTAGPPGNARVGQTRLLIQWHPASWDSTGTRARYPASRSRRRREINVQMSSGWSWFYFPKFSGLSGLLFASVGKSRRRGHLLMHGGAIGRFAGGRGKHGRPQQSVSLMAPSDTPLAGSYAMISVNLRRAS